MKETMKIDSPYTIRETKDGKFVVKLRLGASRCKGRERRVYVCQTRTRAEAEEQIRLLEGGEL